MKNHVIGQHMNQWKTFSWNVSLQGRLDDVSDESRREEAVEYVFANLLLKAMNYQKGRTLVTSAPRWPQAYACTRPYHPRRYFPSYYHHQLTDHITSSPQKNAYCPQPFTAPWTGNWKLAYPRAKRLERIVTTSNCCGIFVTTLCLTEVA